MIGLLLLHLKCLYIVSKTGIPIGNLDLPNINDLKFWNKSLSSPLLVMQFGVVSFCCSISVCLLFSLSLSVIFASLIFFLLLFDASGLIFS